MSWRPKQKPGQVRVHKNGRAKYEFDFQALREADTPVGRALAAMEAAAAKHGVELDLTVKRPIHVPRITARATVVVHGRQVHLGELGVPA